MTHSNKNEVSCSCSGCFSIILFILLFWALFFGLPTSWGTLNIDIFPPGVYLE